MNAPFITDAAAMEELGAAFASVCGQRCLIYLRGNLGAGKTTFARGFMRGLGFTETVKSPTYTLIETYANADYRVYHVDLYRLTGPKELDDLGLRDLFGEDNLCLVEWAERGGGYLPIADVVIIFDYAGYGRRVNFQAQTTHGIEILTRFKSPV